MRTVLQDHIAINKVRSTQYLVHQHNTKMKQANLIVIFVQSDLSVFTKVKMSHLNADQDTHVNLKEALFLLNYVQQVLFVLTLQLLIKATRQCNQIFGLIYAMHQLTVSKECIHP